MQAEELLNLYGTGKREFEEANLSGCNLSGSSLIAIDLSGAVLQNADLSAANLSSSKLVGANLNGANLQEAKLLSTNLSGAELNRVTLVGANLLGANLSGATLVNANLQGANLSGADLYYANLQGANLTNANLQNANLSESNLSTACLAGARLEGANLSAATLPDTVAPSPKPLPVLRLGEFIENLPKAEEYLTISFSPGSLPLQQRWRNNGLSADFMADYFSTFFLQNEENGERNVREEVKNGVSFIANELLENAMKFSDQSSSIDTCIRLYLYRDRLIFLAINVITQVTADKFQNFIQELLNSDPNELYILQLERNAENEDEIGSGLGLLTMINDYSAKLGWQFVPIADRSDQTYVKTMVQLIV